MATGPVEESELTVIVPTPLEEFLDERTDALDVEQAELLAQLLSAYRTVVDGDSDGSNTDTVLTDGAALDERIDERLADRLPADRLDERISTLEADLDDNVEDLRNRVLQLRDALKDLTPADHTHEELETVAALEGRIDALEATLEEIDRRTETFETRLDDTESKLDRLARVVVSLRTDVGGGSSKRERILEEIKRTGSRRKITKARCGSCGEGIHLGMLTEPACPHCGTEHRNLEPSKRFFGKPRLTGDEPSELESSHE